MPSEAELKKTIRAKVVELSGRLVGNVGGVSDDDILLETGLFDSASVLELLVWIESELDVELDYDQLSLDNFGSITRMAEFLSARQSG